MPSEQHQAAADAFGRALFLAELGGHALADTSAQIGLRFRPREIDVRGLIAAGHIVTELDRLLAEADADG